VTELTSEQAYRVMLAFLEGYYERTQSNDLGSLLGGFALTTDGTTMDPAAQTDWDSAIRDVLSK
jgi:hypothetical protein